MKKKIINNTLAFLGLTMLFYSLGCFIWATTNVAVWDITGKVVMVAWYLIILAMVIVAVNSSKDSA